jgi:hypothetical protein
VRFDSTVGTAGTCRVSTPQVDIHVATGLRRTREEERARRRNRAR